MTALATGYCIGCITAVVAGQDVAKRAFFERMDTIHSYMRHHDFSPELSNRIRAYFKRYFKLRSAIDGTAIFNDLDPALQQEVGLFLLNGTVRENKIFKRSVRG